MDSSEGGVQLGHFWPRQPNCSLANGETKTLNDFHKTSSQDEHLDQRVTFPSGGQLSGQIEHLKDKLLKNQQIEWAKRSPDESEIEHSKDLFVRFKSKCEQLNQLSSLGTDELKSLQLSTVNDSEDSESQAKLSLDQKEPQDEKRQLSRSLEDLVADNAYRFVIKDLFKLSSEVKSGPFYQGIGWQIIAGFNDGRGGKHLSVYIKVAHESNKEWSCLASFQVDLVSQNGGPPLSRKCTVLFTKSNNTCGWPEFVSWYKVIDPANGWIKDGTIALEVKMDVESFTFYI